MLEENGRVALIRISEESEPQNHIINLHPDHRWASRSGPRDIRDMHEKLFSSNIKLLTQEFHRLQVSRYGCVTMVVLSG
jgi:hypothetical protein